MGTIYSSSLVHNRVIERGVMAKLRQHQYIKMIPEEAAIPKIIHQTFKSYKLPEQFRRNVIRIQEMNPGWEYRLYDDKAVEEFIRKEYGGGVLKTYFKIDSRYGAARADLFRYLLIYKMGGVYLDIKSTFSCPMDQVIKGDEGCILSQWSNREGERHEGIGLKPEVSDIRGGELQQWHVIAAPGHPFLYAVLNTVFRRIESYRPWRDGTGKVGVLRLTGPIMYTLTIMPIIQMHQHKFVRNEAEVCLNYSILPGDSHKNLFLTHYASSEVSVVRLTGFLRFLSVGYQLGRSLRSRVLPLLRGRQVSKSQ